jgi:hypothetical protein
MSSRDGYRKDQERYCCEQCRMLVPTCDVCKERNTEVTKLRKEIAEWKDANAEGYEQLKRLCEGQDTLLDVIKLVYRKHYLNDDSVGWEELSTILHNSICNALGDDAFIKWLQTIQK